jgi:hypothetical protein
MFESGQLGGKGMQSAGLAVAALGGVSSVALGVAAGLGAVAMSLKVFDDRMKESAATIQAGTAAADAQRRGSRLDLQMQMEKNLAGDLGADLAALESAGISPDLTPGMRGLAARAVRSSGGDAAKRLMATAEKAAKTYNMTPESAMEALLQARAGRLPADALERRAPNIFAKEVGAIAERRVQMREAWTAGAPATEFGAMAERYRGDVGYAEGKTFERFAFNQQEVGLKINRLKEREAKLRELKESGLGWLMPDRIVGLDSDIYKAKTERQVLQSERSLTRSYAEDPTQATRNELARQNIKTLTNLDETISKQNEILKNLSIALDVGTLGLWESQLSKRTRTAKNAEEQDKRTLIQRTAP